MGSLQGNDFFSKYYVLATNFAYACEGLPFPHYRASVDSVRHSSLLRKVLSSDSLQVSGLNEKLEASFLEF
jgi:hypothetical protein